MDHRWLAWKAGPGTLGTTPGQAANGDCGYRGTCVPLLGSSPCATFHTVARLRGPISKIDSDARLKMAVCQSLLAISREVE
jgi:hypothetical protein